MQEEGKVIRLGVNVLKFSDPLTTVWTLSDFSFGIQCCQTTYFDSAASKPNKDAGLLTVRPGLSQGGRASHREARPLSGRSGLSWGQTGPLTGRPGSSLGGQSANRETRPLTGRPSLSKKAGPLIERPCLSQGGRASHREAGPLTRRLLL